MLHKIDVSAIVPKWSKDLIVGNVYRNGYQKRPEIIVSDYYKLLNQNVFQEIQSNFEFLFQAWNEKSISHR